MGHCACGAQELFDGETDDVRMPSVTTLAEAASRWVALREKAREDVRLGGQLRRRADRDAVVADLACVEQQLNANHRQVRLRNGVWRPTGLPSASVTMDLSIGAAI